MFYVSINVTVCLCDTAQHKTRRIIQWCAKEHMNNNNLRSPSSPGNKESDWHVTHWKRKTKPPATPQQTRIQCLPPKAQTWLSHMKHKAQSVLSENLISVALLCVFFFFVIRVMGRWERTCVMQSLAESYGMKILTSISPSLSRSRRCGPVTQGGTEPERGETYLKAKC